MILLSILYLEAHGSGKLFNIAWYSATRAAKQKLLSNLHSCFFVKFVVIISSNMKNLLFLGLLACTLPSFSQCEILNRVSPDGSMLYYMEPVNFYWTSAKSLKGCIVTDKENYFLEMHPVPFPEKPLGNKLKKELELTLSNGEVYKLNHYDTRYVEKDTVMELLYLINKTDLDKLREFDVAEAKIDMLGTEGIRNYVFKLHKSALKDQLACFQKEEEKSKKK
jgi:hypothetical protein